MASSLSTPATASVPAAARERALAWAGVVAIAILGAVMLATVSDYGMTGDETIKEKLQKAVKLIEKTQNHEGGWRYQPAPYDADISVTICEVMGLRAAR